jgi:ankyrin repeat protein
VNQDSVAILRLLVEHGANINLPAMNGNTPLHEAALKKVLEICEILLENGANQLLRNQHGISPRDHIKDTPAFAKLFDRYKPNNPPGASQHNPSRLDQSIVIKTEAFNVPESGRVAGTQTRNRTSSLNRGKPNAKKILLFGTGMNDGEKSRLSSLAKKLNLQLAKEFNANG